MLLLAISLVAKAGTWSDDFELANPPIAATSTESAWNVILDQGSPLAKNATGQLELKAPPAGGRDEISTTATSQGVNDTILETDFPAQIPPEKTRYGIAFLDNLDNMIANFRISTNLGISNVVIDSGTELKFPVISYSSSASTLKLARNSNNEIYAYIVQGASEIQVGSVFVYSGPIKAAVYAVSSAGGPNPVNFLCNNFTFTSDGFLRNILHGEKNTAPAINSATLEAALVAGQNIDASKYGFSYSDSNSATDIAGATIVLDWYKNGSFALSGNTVPGARSGFITDLV